jgi:hypothetical protein
MAEWEKNIEAFFRFMEKRERLRLVKESGAKWPWSDDPILNTYKFTNVKRENDRTTRWMRENWTSPNSHKPAGEIIYNCALFRYFGTTHFAAAIGWQEENNPEKIISAAAQRKAMGLPVFTGAYIIPTLGLRGPKHEVVARQILGPIWENRHRLAEIAKTTRRWRDFLESLSGLPGFGGTGFMAKEVGQDLIHTPVLRDVVDRDSWCPAGPGAQRGLNRIHGRPVGKSVSQNLALKEMCDIFKQAKDLLQPFMPALELHDIQFQLCEFDKYERTRLGEGKPKSRYSGFESGIVFRIGSVGPMA